MSAKPKIFVAQDKLRKDAERKVLRAYTTLGDLIARQRIDHGLTQITVARALGYTTPQFVSNWERGVSLPPYHAIPRLAQMLKIPVNKLLRRLFDVEATELRINQDLAVKTMKAVRLLK